ncbi:PD-(D/E)XK nuclease family protein [Calditrichota bacterium LG25]
MNHIYVTCRAPGSYFAFQDQISEHLEQNHLTALVIVPVNRAVRRLKRTLTNLAGERALIDPPVFTFDRLLLHIYQHLPHPARLLPADTMLVLIQEILEQQAEAFHYLTRGQQVKGGLVNRVWEMSSELRSFGFTSTELAGKDPQELEVHPEKFTDFVRLLEKIEEKLGAEFIDEPFARATAARQVTRQLFEKLFPQVKALYISGYGLFSPPMIDFIKRVGQWLPVHVQLDFLQANQELFRHTLQALEKFKLIDARIEHKSTHSFLARFLFNRKDRPQKRDLSRRIHVAGLNSREREVAFIAGKIRQLNAQGVPLHKIAVTFSHLEKYAQTIRQVFEDFGIPFNLSTGFELGRSPLISAFLDLLAIIEEDFPAEQTLAFLQNQFVQKPEEIDFELLKRVIVMARVRALNEKNLEALKRFIPLQARSDEENGWNQEKALEQVELLKTLLQPLFAFPREAAADAFRKKYLELCERLGLLRWYQTENPRLTERQKEHNFRAYNRFVKVFERSLWTLSLIYGSKPFKSRQLMESLQRAVLTATYNLTEWPDYGVQIMPRLEILSVDFEALFLGGLVDGDFPRASVKDIFFNDRVRSELGLVASEELLDQDRFLFYQLLDGGAQQVYLTYPQYQQEEALVPSSFLADLQDVALVDWQQPADDDPLFENEQKLWKEFGLNLQWIANPEPRQGAIENLRLLRALQPQNETLLENLIDQIRISLARSMGGAFSEYEGNLSAFAVVTDALRQKYTRHTWSVSRLETYARCPMQFFLRYVLKIEAPARMEEELTPLERGQLLHTILFRFFSELKEIGQQDQPWRFADRLLAIALEEFAALPYSGLFWEMEKLRFSGNERLKGILPAFLEKEEERAASMPFLPQNFELSFGYSGDFPADPQSIKEAVLLKSGDQTLRLQGRIDRVDLDEHGHAAIIDYKTGSVGSGLINEIYEGRLLQIPLYLAALPQILPQCTPVYGGLYTLKSSDEVQLKAAVADRSCPSLPASRGRAFLPNKNLVDENDEHQLTFNEMLNRSVAFALAYIGQIQNGVFHHTLNPGDRFCESYCEYRRMCQKARGKLERIAALQKEKPEAVQQNNGGESE